VGERYSAPWGLSNLLYNWYWFSFLEEKRLELDVTLPAPSIADVK
jgi:hypothetical protein